MKITSLFETDLLLEANVLNVKDEFFGTSIVSYLAGYAENIGTEQTQKLFQKKLMKLLMNDERFHAAVRDLPATAPDWAHQAHANRDLVAFQPTEELNNHIQHLSHYLAALEQDINSGTEDEKAIGTRELNGFPRAQNLDALIKSSNEYFDRGTKNVKREAEGMTMIFKARGGFVWYRLDSEQAFKREGKTLGNCIGNMYTAAGAERRGYQIVIMRDKHENTVVAARIEQEGTEINEMKGKGNRPPVPEYMPGVAQFVTKFNFKLSRNAHNDFIAAGYYYANGKLYSKAEAIKELVTTRELGPMAFGLDLHGVVVDNPQLFQDLYGNKVNDAFRRTGRSQWLNTVLWQGIQAHIDSISVYEAREDDGTPRLIGIVMDRKLVALERPNRGVQITEGLMLEDATERDKMQTAAKEFINELFKRDIIEGLAGEIGRELFWNERVVWDAKTNDFRERGGGEPLRTAKGHHPWEVFEKPEEISQIISKMTDDESTLKAIGKPNQYDAVFLATAEKSTGEEGKEYDKTLVMLKTKEGGLIPFSVRGTDVADRDAGFAGPSSLDPDQKTVNTVIGLANEKKYELPRTFRVRHGVVRGKDSKYEQFQPKVEKVDGDPPAMKVSFKHLPPKDRFAAMYSTTHKKKFGGATGGRNTDVMDMFHNVSRDIDRAGHGGMHQHGMYNQPSDAFDWDKRDLGKWYETHFSPYKPDELWRLEVGYGVDRKHGVLMFVDSSKNLVTRIDSATEGQSWQGWDDYEKVADQLTKFAQAHNLKFADKSLGRRNSPSGKHQYDSELAHTADGTLTTQARKKAAEIERLRARGSWAREGTDELEFSDGAKLTRMGAQEQADWMRKGVRGGVRGEAWKLLNTEGNPIAVFTTMHNNLHGVFAQYWWNISADEPEETRQARISKVPTHRHITKNVMPYLKTAQRELDWKLPPSRMVVPSGHALIHGLDYLNSNTPVGNGSVRRYGRQQARNVANGTKNAGWGSLSLTELLRVLGWARRGGTSRRGRQLPDYWMSITPKGRQARQDMQDDIEQGNDINLLDYIDGTPPVEGWERPTTRAAQQAAERPERPARQPRAPGAARAGTKSQQALQWFTEFNTENDRIPTRGEFIAQMENDPFNMGKAGAQTYYYTTKAKFNAQQGLGEAVSRSVSAQLGAFSRFFIV